MHTSLLSEALHWIGGIDVYNGPVLRPDNSYDGGWAWIDGTPFNFVNWNAGETFTDFYWFLMLKT